MGTVQLTTPDAFLGQLLNQCERVRAQTQESGISKSDHLRVALEELLGDFGKDRPPLDSFLLERVELNEAIRERVAFTTLHGLRMTAYVMIPKRLEQGEKRPAVLLWHGHGHGSRSLVGLEADDSSAHPTGKPSDNLALEFARRGLVALAPEIVGFGDRRLERDLRKNPEIRNSCFNLSVSLLMTGKTAAGLRTYEGLRAMDYLISRDEVDPTRVGNMGHSGGGMVASLSAALDLRVKASVIGIYPNTYRDSILSMQHCLCNYIPGVLNHAEMPDLLSLLAPRHLFIEAGIHDAIFPVSATEYCISELKRVYHTHGIDERLGSHLFEGKHEVCGERSIDWLSNVLTEL